METHQNIGQLINRKRLSHGLSTHELSRALHIRERYIIALEMGEFHVLPGTAYTRAYIERILQFLGHDPADALASYDSMAEAPGKKLFQLSMRWGDSPHPSPQFASGCAAAVLLMLAGWHTLSTPAQVAFSDPYTPIESGEVEPLQPSNPSQCTDDKNSSLPCYWQSLADMPKAP